MPAATRTWVVGFLAMVCVATGLRLWGLDAGLPHLMTRPDEEILLFKTRFPASGRLDLEYDVAHPGVPSSYIFLLWGVGEIGLPVLQSFDLAPPGDYLRALNRFPEKILLLQRLFSALAGVGAVVAVMLFVHRETGSRAALAAGALLATSFLHVRESHSAKPDVALSFWVIVALGLLAQVARRATTPRAVAAGAAIGLGMAMKPPALMLLAPAWLAAVLGSESRGWRRFVPATAVVIGLVAAAVFVATSPDSVLNPTTRQQLVNIIYVVFPALDPNPATAPTVVPGAGEPASHSFLGGAWHYYDFTLRYGVGLLVTVAAPLGLAWGFLSRKPLAALSATFTLVAFVVFAASPASQPRYMVPLLPALVLLVAGASDALVRRVFSPRWQGSALALLTAVLIAEPLHDSIAFDRIVARTDTRVLTTEWIRDNVPAGSVVGLAGAVFWSWGDPVVPAAQRGVRTGLTPAELDAAQVQYLVTHDYPLFSSSIDPEQIARLAPRLTLLQEFDPFVGPRERARFDPQDAYYVPLAGLEAIDRPGPVVRIYQVR